MKRTLLIAALAQLASGAAFAQGTPSMDDLINSLRPRAGGATRGIRPTGPVAVEPAAPLSRPASAAVAAPVVPRNTVARPAAPHAAAPRVAGSQPAAPAGEGMANLTVQFENGSDRLTPGAAASLDVLGRALTNAELSAYRFQIVGHTDAVGRPETNQSLSERRAAAVAEYLVSRYHVDRGRLESLGKGQSDPLVPARDGVSEPRNRRVQVINLGS